MADEVLDTGGEAPATAETTEATDTDTLIGGGTAVAQTPAPASEETSEGGQDAEEKPWYDGLPDELLTEKVKTFKSVADLAKAHQNLSGLLGKKGVALPGEDATPEEIAAYRQAAGIPEASDGYTFQAEGIELDPEAMGAFSEVAHQAGLSQAQYESVMGHYAQTMRAAQEELVAQEKQVAQELANERTATVERLQAEWGDTYKQELEKVRQVAQRTGLGALLQETGLGNTYEAVMAMHKIASYLPTEDHVDGATRTSMNEELASLNAKLAEMPRTAPGREQLMARRDELYQRGAKDARF